MDRTLRAVGVGETGCVAFLKAVYGLGVIDHRELLGLLMLHGAVLRLEPSLDDGTGGIDEVLEALARELGGSTP